MTKIITTIALSIALGTAANATTVDSQDRQVTEINVKGIDMHSIEGVARVDRLARAAARLVCNVGDSRDLGATRSANRCYSRALADVQTQIARLEPGTQTASLTIR